MILIITSQIALAIAYLNFTEINKFYRQFQTYSVNPQILAQGYQFLADAKP